MLYCFPPGTLFLLERPKWYSGGEERARGKLGRRSPRRLAQLSTGGHGHSSHPTPLAPRFQPHLPPGKQQEEHRWLRGWRWEGGGKEPEPPEGEGVGGLGPIAETGGQQRGMTEGQGNPSNKVSGSATETWSG